MREGFDMHGVALVVATHHHLRTCFQSLFHGD
ncbi:MAG: hypothetical protein RLZZ173_278, partial [Pseudomonadota bacterium]